MRAAILAVGSELLGSERLDTNSLRITAELERHGVELVRKAVVGDTREGVAAALRELFAAAELVLVTGGLGPTADDLTRQAVADALGRRLLEDPAIVADIRAKFAAFGMRMPEVNRRQAEVVEGAEVLANGRGTAPGLRLEHAGGDLFLFPGVPHELEAMIEAELVPWLESHGRRALETRVLKVACVPESTAEERLAPAYEEFGGEAIGLLASAGELQVRLSARGAAAEEGGLARLERRVAGLLGDSVFSRRAADTLESVVGELLATAGATVATAESCTGGLVAERLTRVAGSSSWFVGSAVTYSNRLKVSMLGVDAAAIELEGAVSPVVARAMAAGVRRRLGADYGLGVTGIAGPGGGTAEKPVGTVHVALAGPGEDEPAHRHLRLPGDRRRVRRLTSQWALEMLRRRLLETAGGGRDG